jgi:hypothetical protein
MCCIQQKWRRGQNRFCLEARGMKGRRRGDRGEGERDGSSNVYTYE